MDGAGGGFCRSGGQADSAVPGDNDAVGARQVGGTDYSAEIVGILDLIKKDEEGILPFFGGFGKEIVDLRILKCGSLRDHALVPSGLGELVQALAGKETDRGAVLFGKAQDSLHGALCGTFQQEKFLNCSSRPIGFDDGIAAFDPVFIGLRLTGKESAVLFRSAAGRVVPLRAVFSAVLPPVFSSVLSPVFPARFSPV